MMYNSYTLERMASEIQKERIREAKEQSRWEMARKAARNLSNQRRGR